MCPAMPCLFPLEVQLHGGPLLLAPIFGLQGCTLGPLRCTSVAALPAFAFGLAKGHAPCDTTRLNRHASAKDVRL